MYKVIEYFTDLQDQDHPYNVGDNFPRDDLEVKEERLAELAGSDNRRGIPLIRFEEVPLVNETDRKPASKKTAKK